MNRIFVSFIIILLLAGFSGCKQKEGSLQPLVVAAPERPSGQEDVILLTAPKIDTVRVGFIGLGMRGPGAVTRFTHIPGTQIQGTSWGLHHPTHKSYFQFLLPYQCCFRGYAMPLSSAHG